MTGNGPGPVAVGPKAPSAPLSALPVFQLFIRSPSLFVLPGPPGPIPSSSLPARRAMRGAARNGRRPGSIFTGGNSRPGPGSRTSMNRPPNRPRPSIPRSPGVRPFAQSAPGAPPRPTSTPRRRPQGTPGPPSRGLRCIPGPRPGCAFPRVTSPRYGRVPRVRRPRGPERDGRGGHSRAVPPPWTRAPAPRGPSPRAAPPAPRPPSPPPARRLNYDLGRCSAHRGTPNWGASGPWGRGVSGSRVRVRRVLSYFVEGEIPS